MCLSFRASETLLKLRKHPHIPRHIPMQDGRGLSQVLLSPVIHFNVEAPCRVYPGSHLYVMLLPAKWPWSLTFRPNWGTPGSSQWDNSKPEQKTTHTQQSGVKKNITAEKRISFIHMQRNILLISGALVMSLLSSCIMLSSYLHLIT